MSRRINVFVIYLVFILLPPVVLAEKNIIDPMRPPGQSSIKVYSSSSVVSWRLSAVLISPERRLAMINNKLVGIGGKINGAKVKAIHSHAVELEVGGGECLLLKPANYSIRRARN